LSFPSSGVIWIRSHELDPARSRRKETGRAASGVARLEVALHLSRPSVAAVNELVVPAGVPLHVSLTSARVMKSFFVRQVAA